MYNTRTRLLPLGSCLPEFVLFEGQQKKLTGAWYAVCVVCALAEASLIDTYVLVVVSSVYAAAALFRQTRTNQPTCGFVTFPRSSSPPSPPPRHKHYVSTPLGRSVPAAPPGRPSIASNPPADEEPSLERHGSTDSYGGGRKEKKKKHHKDKDKDKSKKKVGTTGGILLLSTTAVSCILDCVNFFRTCVKNRWTAKP